MKRFLQIILILSCYVLAITAAVIFLHKNKHDCTCPQIDQLIDSTWYPHSSHYASIHTRIHKGKQVLWQQFSYTEHSKVDSVLAADWKHAEEELNNLEK